MLYIGTGCLHSNIMSSMSLQSCSTSRLRSSEPAIDLTRVLDIGPITKKSKWVRLGTRIDGHVLLINLRCLESSMPAALSFSAFSVHPLVMNVFL